MHGQLVGRAVFNGKKQTSQLTNASRREAIPTLRGDSSGRLAYQSSDRNIRIHNRFNLEHRPASSQFIKGLEDAFQ